MKPGRVLYLICLLLLLVAGAPGFAAQIVCTTTIVGDVVSQIAGGSVDVQVLFSPEADPHAFEPQPQDLVMLSRADRVLINGLGLESGLDQILSSLGDAVISLSDNLPGLLPAEEDGEHADHGTFDPHVWFDPILVSHWVDVIVAVLIDLAPSLEAEFRARAQSYQAELLALDEWIVSELERIAPEHRQLVTDHHIFGYFAARYGMEQVGTVFPGLSTLAEPSAKDIASLIETIEALHVPAIFVGTTVNPSLAKQIATDTGIRVVSLYTGALSEPDGPAGTYLDFMRSTVRALVDGLAQP